MQKKIMAILVFSLGMLLCYSSDKNQETLLKNFYKLDSVYHQAKENNPKKAYAVAEKQDSLAAFILIDSIKLKAHFQKARSLQRLGFYDVGLKELYKGLKKAEEQQNLYYQYRYLYSIGQIYQDMGDLKQTLSFYLQAKKAAIQNPSFQDTLLVNYDIAAVYDYGGQLEKSLPILLQNVKVPKETQYWDAIFFGLEGITGHYAIQGKIKEALQYQEEILQYPKSWESVYRKNLLYNHLAELWKEVPDWDKAQQFTDSTFKYARKMELHDWLWGCYRLQSRIDEGRGDYKSALKNHKLYLATKDSVMRENYDNKMAVMTSFYELERKQSQIDLLEKDNKIKSSQRNGIFMGALLLLGAVIGFFIFRNQKEKERLQRLFAQQVLQTQEQEKQRISGELHDSVGQNILFIKNQLYKYNENNHLQAVLSTVDNTIEEVRNIAKDLFPNQLEKYGLAAAVNTLTEKVRENTPIFASADLSQVEDFIAKENHILIYRIIQEAVNNAIKYSESSAFRITANLQNNHIHWLIQDNGAGFDKSQLAEKQQRSFGLLSIEERVKMLGGNLTIETAKGKGTKLSFVIPKSA